MKQRHPMIKQTITFFLLLLNAFTVIPECKAQMPLTFIDSIMAQLPLEDQLKQVMLVEGADTLAGPSGGILVQKYVKNPAEPLQTYPLSPLVFTRFQSGSLETGLVNTPGFLAILKLSAVNEPHLLYETGRLIGQSNKRQMIDCIINADEVFGRGDWRGSEFSSGLAAEGLLLSNSIKIIAATEFDPQEIANTPFLVLVPSGQVNEFILRCMNFFPSNLEAQDKLKQACRGILELKYKHRLYNDESIAVDPDNLIKDIERASVTLLANDNNLLPVLKLENKMIACISVAQAPDERLIEFMGKYAKCDFFNISQNASVTEFSRLWSDLANYDLIIEAVIEDSLMSEVVNENYSMFQRWLNMSQRCITVWSGSASRLKQNQSVLEAPCLLASWDLFDFGSLVPQAIFGAMDVEGVSPEALNTRFIKGSGISIQNIGRLAYNHPEAVNINAGTLAGIDSMAQYAISQQATPGCQILVAKDNQVIYHKSFGYHTYDSLRAVKDDDLYDMASVTKVSAALPALMKLYDEGKFDPDATLGTYLPYFKKSNKSDLTFRELLAHQAGLQAWIPFWQHELKQNGKFRKRAISYRQSDKYNYELSPGLYLKNNYGKHIYKQIKTASNGEKKYLYSDLSFYLYPQIVEKISGQPFETFLAENFYKPLGAVTLTYNPLSKFPLERIVPTEYDSLFRKTQVHGSVHDEGAALMHGVSGHAGLFGDANDLAKLWQMYCNYGEYGGIRYLADSTLREFSRCQFPENKNRRGLGFDRPMPTPVKDGNTAISVSQSSFGHTGFTGNFVWVDPEQNLVYIFLSNRVYPTRNNTKLYDLNIRTSIQEIIYEAIRKGSESVD